jgi:hypothetical protein
MSQGKAVPVACREAGISQRSCYRWRKQYGGLELDQAKRMKNLVFCFDAFCLRDAVSTLHQVRGRLSLENALIKPAAQKEKGPTLVGPVLGYASCEQARS